MLGLTLENAVQKENTGVKEKLQNNIRLFVGGLIYKPSHHIYCLSDLYLPARQKVATAILDGYAPEAFDDVEKSSREALGEMDDTLSEIFNKTSLQEVLSFLKKALIYPYGDRTNRFDLTRGLHYDLRLQVQQNILNLDPVIASFLFAGIPLTLESPPLSDMTSLMLSNREKHIPILPIQFGVIKSGNNVIIKDCPVKIFTLSSNAHLDYERDMTDSHNEVFSSLEIGRLEGSAQIQAQRRNPKDSTLTAQIAELINGSSLFAEGANLTIIETFPGSKLDLSNSVANINIHRGDSTSYTSVINLVSNGHYKSRE
ncbi:MAG: hypothetical protein Q7S61_02965 [bacterium]|nr:hypothetical protein [bacterium]